MTERQRKRIHTPTSKKGKNPSKEARFAVLMRMGNDQKYWQRCVALNQVYVVVDKRGKSADVVYDTYSKKPREADRLSKRGIDIVFDLFESHGCKKFFCGDTSGFTQKRIPFEDACRLAEKLCEVFDMWAIWKLTDGE